ncbi:MAG TPA: lipoate--protein ligase family protein [Syntrophomonadaceae bacterium]|nr:lipoate--protein ligase family protein [Syntrophomonadaceae bacterium]
MNLYNLGPVSWIESQSLYHALALLGREGLIICYPDSAYVCLGLHDDLDHEIDQSYCRKKGIPLLRRETGGGVVYLDSQQVFYQLVLRRDNPLVPLRRTEFYQKFLQPAISVYQSLNMPVELKAPADLAARGLKCSGNACGDIDECVVYVGNLLLDFDFHTMSKVLRLPNEIFREYLFQTMRENITTLADWCEKPLDYSYLVSGLISGFYQELGSLTPCTVDGELRSTTRQVGERLISPEWLQMPGRRPVKRRVKISEGIYLSQETCSSQENCLVFERNGVELNIVLKQDSDQVVAI